MKGKKFRGKANKGAEKKEKRGSYKGTKGKRNNPMKKKREGMGGAKKTYCFNRYRDKNRVKEELVKKHEMEKKIEEQYETSESEEETADPMQQLLSTFKSNGHSKKSYAFESSDESDAMEEDENNKEVEEEQSDSDSSVDGEMELGSEVGDDSEGESNEDIDTQSNDDGNDELETPAVDEKIDEAINEEEVDVETEKDDKTEFSNDPFTQHLRDDLHDSLLISVSSKPQSSTVSNVQWPQLGRLAIQIPKSEQEKELKKNQPKVTVLETKMYAPQGKQPSKITTIKWDQLNVKKQIQPNITAANKSNLIKRECDLVDNLTPLQKEIFSIVNNYQDFYYPSRSFVNAEEIRFIYCLHAVNHLLKTRTKILHHNARLGKKEEVPDEFRDQGLVRPKVIILVPFRNSAYLIIKMLIDILVPGDSSQVINKNRFENDFTGSEIVMPKKNAKPEDYELTFSGNSDDTFRIGLSITKKSLKLYSDFYSSDLIIASPLGLRVIIGADGEEERDFDFLASVELLIMDQTEIFLMQNWDHLLHVLDHLHMQPKKTHGTDFSRLRSWAVNGWTKYYRQTLLFSAMPLPEINSLFNQRCLNYAGKVRVHNPIDSGSIRQVAVQVPQFFRRIEAKDPMSAIDSRFEHFIKEIIPQHKDSIMAHTMIYVPSYFDYVRIRNHFKKEDTSFVQICEYSKDAKIARARDMFFHTEAQFLLYSERFHFFRRVRIKGIRHIIFYQPPVFPHFYSELCNLMQEGNQNKFGGSESNMSVTILYTKYDLLQLSALVGSERTAKMSQSERNIHMFMTGE